MQEPIDPEEYELRDEYDLSEVAVTRKGRYAPQKSISWRVTGRISVNATSKGI